MHSKGRKIRKPRWTLAIMEVHGVAEELGFGVRKRERVIE